MDKQIFTACDDIEKEIPEDMEEIIDILKDKFPAFALVVYRDEENIHSFLDIDSETCSSREVFAMLGTINKFFADILEKMGCEIEFIEKN